MKSLIIEGQKRSELGKKSARQLRREERVPCVLYGEGENLHFSAPIPAFKDLVYSPAFHTVNLQVDGQSYEAIIKAIQFDPLTDEIDHVDFLSLVPGRKVVVELPVNVYGNSVGVRNGGKLKLKVRKLTAKTTPEHLVETIDVDVTHLRMGKSVRVSEINLEGIEIQNNPGLPVVTCEVPRALRGKGNLEEEEPAAEGEEAAAEEAAAE